MNIIQKKIMLTAITALLTIGAQNSTADSSAQAIID